MCYLWGPETQPLDAVELASCASKTREIFSKYPTLSLVFNVGGRRVDRGFRLFALPPILTGKRFWGQLLFHTLAVRLRRDVVWHADISASSSCTSLCNRAVVRVEVIIPGGRGHAYVHTIQPFEI